VTRGGADAAVVAFARVKRVLDEIVGVPRKVAVAVAPELTGLLQQQFASGVDPYGRAWASLKPATLARGRRAPPLTDKRALRDGTRARVLDGNRAGLHIVVGARYGAFHQTGTKYMVARRILPSQGMPMAWRRLLVAATRRLAKQAAEASRA